MKEGRLLRLTYVAPAHHFLEEDGKRIPGGETFTASNSRAMELLTDPTVLVVEAEEGDLTKLTRDELNEMARRTGIQSPEELPNKESVVEALTIPDLVDGEDHHDEQEDVLND